MVAAMMTVCNPGDKVAVFSPFYENYGADAILSGADPVYVPLVPPDFHYDRAVLEQAFRDGAKALILCNPSNPCGKVFTMGEMEEIAELAKRYDAFVITDEVYEYIIYDGNRHISMAALPGMYERTDHLQLAFKDVFHDRMETGLSDRTGARDRGGKEGS